VNFVYRLCSERCSADNDVTLMGVSSSTEVSKAQQRGTFLRVYPPPPDTDTETATESAKLKYSLLR
jgi:hypothetical protein